jgi:DNA repair protein RadC
MNELSCHIPKIILQVVCEGYIESLTRRISGSADINQLLAPYFAPKDREEFVGLYLDAKNGIVGLHTISIGSLPHTIVHPREVFKAAILVNASAIIIAHNHPSGDPTPSQEDRLLTSRLESAGSLMGMRLLDHVVFGRGRYVSFADQGWMNVSGS